MEKPDVSALAQQMIEAVRGFVAKARSEVEAAFGERIAVLEGKIAALPVPKDGKDADPEMVRAEVAKAVGALPVPKDGKDVPPEVVAKLVGEAVAALPKPADGKSVTVEDVAPLIASEFSKAVGSIPRPRDGKDVEPAAVRSMVAEAVAAIPKPKDGASVTADDVKPLVSEAVTKAVAALPRAKDGESVPAEQVQRMVDEAVTKAVRAVRMPKDGDDGEPGRDAAELDILPSIDEAKSYRRGTWASHNGGLIKAVRQTDQVKDGAIVEAGWVVMVEGIAAVVVTQGDDPRELEVAAMLTSGTKAVAGFRMPVMIYREVWKEGEFQKGDVVTWGGSAWHSQVDNNKDKPGTSAAWKMMVKEGRPGKDAEARAAAPREPVRLK